MILFISLKLITIVLHYIIWFAPNYSRAVKMAEH